MDHSFPQLDIIHKHSKSEAEDTRELENDEQSPLNVGKIPGWKSKGDNIAMKAKIMLWLTELEANGSLSNVKITNITAVKSTLELGFS